MEMCSHILILMWLLICYSPDAYQVPTVYTRPYALFPPEAEGVVMDLTTPMGGGGGASGWVYCVCVGGGWGLGREQCVGETQESCSTTVAGILQRPSPVLRDMSVCVTNKKSAQF